MRSQGNAGKTFWIWAVIFSLVMGQLVSVPRVFAIDEKDQVIIDEKKEDNQDESDDGSQKNSGTEDNSSGEVSLDTANLRFIFTSDLHGQITTEDYEKGTVFTTGGLCRTVSLIKEAKSEVPENNTLLFDLGDNMYDYTTDYIYNYDDTVLQPIYKALSMVGYDAITLGNHDFEYTLSYIQRQLKDSGLESKVVLSNVKDVNTGKSIWAENKIFEKELMTSSGRTMKVKVGVIGETIPELSDKRENYKGVLQPESIIKNVEKEVSDLKEKGADVIVVIAHSGVGAEVVNDSSHNVGYALTKIEGVDAVLCGHKHANFPVASGTKYDFYPGVDLTTGLVNGKSLIQVKSRGGSVGIADLQLSDTDNKISIVGRNTAIRNVNANTEVDQAISDCMGEWTKIFLSDCSEILSEIGNQTELQNYFGTQEDTDLMQLMNNIKIGYGLEYIYNTATEYKGYPVVGVSPYLKYGSGDSVDYVDITGDFKRSNIYDMVVHRTRLYVYEMTGAQIREWLEWSAGCYATQGENLLSKEDFPSFSGEKPLQYALQEKYLTEWKNFFVFDGIEYEINPSVAPRYSEAGKKINDTSRITSLTRNGVPVADTDTFVVVSHEVPDNTLFNTMNPKKITYTTSDQYRGFIESFINKMAMTGNLKPLKDNNWSVSYSDQYNYVLKSAKAGQAIADKREWLTSSTGDEIGDDGYWYYLLETDQVSKEDKSGPGINAAIVNGNAMTSKGTIVVQAGDFAGVRSVKYKQGKYNINDAVWSDAKQISNGKFTYSKNAIYSILAEDKNGNRSIAYIKTSNIDSNVLAAPVVNTYSNRKNYIEGTAKAGSKIYFQVENGKNYSSTVTSKGTFKYALPPQKAGTKIFVYVVDSKGKTSSRTTVTVKRTGPNKPTLNNNIKTNSKVVSGKTNDVYAYPLVLVDDKTLYVPDSNTEELYKKSSFYNKSYKVVVTNMKMEASGAFQFTLPDYLKSSSKVKLRTIDALSRYSLPHKVGVTLAAPRKPSISQVSNLSKSVKVYTAEAECTSATVQVDSKKYASSKAKYDKKTGYCYTVTIPRSDSTSTLKIWLTNKVGKSTTIVLHPTEKAPNKPKLDKVKKSAKKVTGKVHLVGSKDGKNTVKNTKTKVYVYVNGKKYTAKISSDGTFSVKFKKRKLKSKDKVVCYAKNCNGTSLKRTVYVK